MIRVLHFVGYMNRGGQETFIMNIYRHINRTKVQFDFVVHTQNKCDYDDEIIALGGRIHRLPRLKDNPIKYFLCIKNLIHDNSYKIIHRHTSNSSVFFELFAAKLGGAQEIIAHSHSTYDMENTFIHKICRGLLNAVSTTKFACSDTAGAWLFGNKCYYIIKNGIDSNQFIYDKDIRDRIRKEFGIEENYTVIGHVGRFHEAKNHGFLIDIFKKFHDKNNKSVLLLVGDGDLRSLIEKKVNDLELNDSVIFTRLRSDIPELLQAMDVFVFTSLYEGLPVTLIEAQTAGLKIIASDTITEEIKLTDLVEFISLEKPASYWADQVMRYSDGYERKNTYSEICNAGYDVKDSAKWLEEFYLDQNHQ